MKNRLSFFVLVGMSLVAVCSLASTFVHRGVAQEPTTSPVPKKVLGSKPGSAAHKVQLANNAGTWSVQVDWTLDLNNQQETLYQQMATLMSGYTTVPQDRTNFYSGVSGTYTINGWGGVLNNVKQQSNGTYLLTITVSPFIAQGVILTDYQEQYSVDANNNVTYAGFLDPLGWAGESLSVTTE